jgi:hypothetical protein
MGQRFSSRFKLVNLGDQAWDLHPTFFKRLTELRCCFCHQNVAWNVLNPALLRRTLITTAAMIAIVDVVVVIGIGDIVVAECRGPGNDCSRTRRLCCSVRPQAKSFYQSENEAVG